MISWAAADRARSYLHANCAGCHRPGGPGRGDIDLRAETPFTPGNGFLTANGRLRRAALAAHYLPCSGADGGGPGAHFTAFSDEINHSDESDT